MSRVVIDNLSNSNFLKLIEKQVRKTIRKYNLFNHEDKILVAVSGGKDSSVLLHILNKLRYNVEAVFVNVGNGEYAEKSEELVKQLCEKEKIKLNILSFKEEFGFNLKEMLKILFEKGIRHKSCMVCGIIRRNLLNRFAKKNKFDYLATGHNLDDEAEAFLMNIFRSDFNLALRQGPKPGIVENNKFVQRVKPLYFIPEKDILRYSKIMKFPVNYCICPFSSNAYRRQFINMLNKFEEKHESVKHNIVSFQEKMINAINKKYLSQRNLKYCEICGEPSATKICKTCKLLKEISD